MDEKLTLNDFDLIKECTHDNIFTFIVNGEDSKMTSLFAEILSPKVRTLRPFDHTVDASSFRVEEHIVTVSPENHTVDTFSHRVEEIVDTVLGMTSKVAKSTNISSRKLVIILETPNCSSVR
jgi:hypothetical protein